ncbi:MAG: hypothetical protein ACLVJH_16155 [Faecalibacterium prausnitzii]
MVNLLPIPREMPAFHLYRNAGTICASTGSDGRFYRDELCLDGTNGKTIALRDIKGLIPGDREKAILNQWETVLQWAKKAENYSPSLTYGVYQIYAELWIHRTLSETSGQAQFGITWSCITALAGLKTLVKDYYNSEIVPVLFEYRVYKIAKTAAERMELAAIYDCVFSARNAASSLPCSSRTGRCGQYRTARPGTVSCGLW